MPCVRQTKGRYVKEDRKSPPYPAQDCKNKARVGRDGTMWISLPDKNLKYTWKPYGGAAHKKAIKELPKSEKTEWVCEGGKCRRVSKNGNGKPPPKGILKEPRTKSKTKKGVRFANGNGNGNGNGRGLEKLTVVELKQRIRDKGLKGYSGKNKAALVAMLRNGNGVKASAKKPASKKKTPASERKAAGYTKRTGNAGQTLYYKNGKRVAKRNVPVKCQ